jgi:hypothetical protein
MACDATGHVAPKSPNGPACHGAKDEEWVPVDTLGCMHTLFMRKSGERYKLD